MSGETLEPAERFIDVSGRSVRVRIHGEGPPVLLINGLGANVSMFTPLARQLEGFQVITFDAPGAGKSGTPLLPYRLSMIARVASRVLDELGHARVDVLGYSLGGAVAQQLAFQDPGRVRRLVLVSTSCGAGAVPGAWRALLAVATPARHYAPSGYAAAMKIIDLAPAEKESDFLRAEAEAWHHESPPSMRGYALQMTAFSTFNSLRWLHRVEQPTLVVHGTDDHLVPLANGAILAAYLPHARLRIVDRWGHYLLQDAASGAGRDIAEFLRSEDHEGSQVWKASVEVGVSDMTEYVRSAPKSRYPLRHVSSLVRMLSPAQQKAR